VNRVNPENLSLLYLHGFASGAGSTKAGYFRQRFRERQVPFAAPDFNEPDFATLTMTRSLDQIADAVTRFSGPVVLMGSSLGGTLAIIAADRFPDRVVRTVLLAPAVMFAKPGHHLLQPERLAEWRRSGRLTFFHYGFKEDRSLNYEFYEDSLRYDPFEAVLKQPSLIFQGLRDASVNYRDVEQFARTRPNVTLSLLDDDHQLTASLPRIWAGVEDFLFSA
jgi:pimeloyl-ACP methyl ester carboxylesterase